MAKKKCRGHYYRNCWEIKSNEKFSGKGNTTHICKSCAALPATRRMELQLLNRITEMMFKPFLTKDDRILLKKYAKGDRHPELKEYAKGVLKGLNNPPDMADIEDENYFENYFFDNPNIDLLPFVFDDSYN